MTHRAEPQAERIGWSTADEDAIAPAPAVAAPPGPRASDHQIGRGSYDARMPNTCEGAAEIQAEMVARGLLKRNGTLA